MEITYNQRGFGHIEFTDDRGNKCSMQESSSVDIRLWLGIDNPRIVNFSKGTPFEVPTPEGCSVFGRMELSQEMVQRMLPALHCFAQTGAIAPDWEDVVDDQTKHPLWAEWLSWYGHHYTTHVPLRNGMPDNLDQRLSWDTYKAARTDVVSKLPVN